MIVSARKVLELSKKYKLVENLDAREKNPEGVGLDLRVGEVYKIGGKGFLGVTNRKTPNAEKVADIKKHKGPFTLKARGYILIKTMEKINVPDKKIVVEEGKPPVYLMPYVYPRSTLQRSGILLLATKTDPGYSGELTFGLANLSSVDFEFELGARLVNLVFEQVHGEISRPYKGQWKGGRVAAKKFERQI